MRQALLTILGVLIADQWLKIYVKLNFTLGQKMELLGDWFVLRFIENRGMAFGIELPFKGGKLLLTFFRIIVFAVGLWYIREKSREGAPKGFIYASSLILAGALGNIIDSLFYGVIFTESTSYTLAKLDPSNSYGSVFSGEVVDMLHFPIIQGHYPDWLPFWSGQYFEFFQPIFNIADSAITLGVVWIFIRHKKYFPAQTATS